MNQQAWIVTRRAQVASEFAGLGGSVRQVGGLFELLRSTGAPPVIAVDVADIDLLMADAALKIARKFPRTLLVALGEQEEGPPSEGVDEVLAPPSAWASGVARLARELALLAEAGWSGKSESLRGLLSQVRQAGPAEISVLITGESGSGKELVAAQLHKVSPRAGGPFLAVNSGAIPETLLESELFGYEKGAFTGATSSRHGIFEAARGGTVFLDEIGDMPPATQVKLLRVLEARTFRRLGSTVERETDVRVISATHRDLAQLEYAGTFRKDLYYRLSAVTLRVAPLRERPGDLLPLLSAFWDKLAGGLRPPSEITVEALRRLRSYSWPGNVRELRNFAEASAVATAGRPLSEEHVMQYLQRQTSLDRYLPVATGLTSHDHERELVIGAVWHLGRQIQELKALLEKRLPAPAPFVEAALEPPAASIAFAERRAIEAALLETGGNRREAARRLRIGERTLYRKIKEYGLN